MSEDEFEEIDLKEVFKGMKKALGLKSKKPGKKKEKKKADEEERGEEIDFQAAVKFLKENKKIMFYIALVSIILVASWIRTLSIPHYNNILLGLDPFVFNRYAEELIEKGYLPERDELRYFPEGFNTFQEQQMNTYFIAGLYYLLSPFMPGLEVVSVSIIYPVIAFAIGIIFYFLMVKEFTDKQTALIAVLLLSFAPSYLFRTIAGFADKEALAMVFWFSMTWALIKSLKAKNNKDVLKWGLLSGLLGGLNALTWGGANFLFHSIALAFIALTLINKLSKNYTITFFSWAIPTLLMNAALTMRYGGFKLYGHQIFVSTFIAIIIIVLRVIYDSFIKSRKPKAWPEAVHFTVFLAIIAIPLMITGEVTGVFSITNQVNSAVETIFHPFGTCPFCISVSENQAPYFFDPQRGVSWWERLSWFIPLFIIGSLLYYQKSLEKFRYKAMPQLLAFGAFILIFMFSKYSTDPKYAATNLLLGSVFIYFLPLYIIVLVLDYLVNHKSRAWNSISPVSMILIAWFSLSVIATRGAVRIIFTLTPVALVLSAYCITRGKEIIRHFLKDKVYAYSLYLIVILVGSWAFMTTLDGADSYFPSFTGDWIKSMDWVKDNTSTDAVFTHWWDYGYWVQAMGERATTVDGGNYIVQWDEVIGGYLFSGYNSTEILESLNFFSKNTTEGLKRPDYFLIVDDDVLKYVQMANIGGRPGYYAVYTFQSQIKNNIFMPENYSTLLVFQPASGPGRIGQDIILPDNKVLADSSTYVINILVPFSDSQEFGPVLAALYNTELNTQSIMVYNCVCETNVGCSQVQEEGISSCYNFIQQGLIHIPSNLRDRLMTELYILNLTVPGFETVYDDNATPLSAQSIISQYDPTDIKIYRINYDELEAASAQELSA